MINDQQQHGIYTFATVLCKHYYKTGNLIQMAKKTNPKAKSPSQNLPEFQISKKKSFTVNLNAYIKMLEKRHPQISSKDFITHIHSFVKKFKQKNKQKNLGAGARQKIKVCVTCDGWCGTKNMVQCQICQDYYHNKCLSQEEKILLQNQGICSRCESSKTKQIDKNKYLSQLIQDRCFKCNNEREGKQSFVHCLRCTKRFHKKCYGKSIVVCPSCKNQIDVKKKINGRQSTLFEYGCSSSKNKSSPTKTLPEDCQEQTITFIKKHTENKQQDEESTRALPVSELFCFNHLELDEEQVQKYKEGLLFAILAKKMNYIQNLEPIDCSLDNNSEESLDFGLDHMSKKQYRLYQNYKKQPIGPFRFVYTEGMGYDVVADKYIREKTLICQYVGQVVTLRRCIELQAQNKNDSLMELRSGCNSEETLIIRPDRYTNMARFINGINNAKGKNKANVATVRMLAKGIPTVILYSLKPIKSGQSLLYDYNAGDSTCKYDTSNFI